MFWSIDYLNEAVLSHEKKRKGTVKGLKLFRTFWNVSVTASTCRLLVDTLHVSCLFLQVITPCRKLILCADNRKEMEDWIAALKTVQSREHFEVRGAWSQSLPPPRGAASLRLALSDAP